MPHCIIEYSRNISGHLQIQDVLVSLSSIIQSSLGVEPKSIKMRAIAFDEYLLNAPYEYFIHTCVHMLEGRTDMQKEHLTRGIQEYIFQKVRHLPISLNTQISDIHKDSYQKI